MDVLGYEDVGGYAEALLFAGLFEDLLYGVFCGGSLEEGLPFVTTEGDDVELVGLLETFEARWHGGASSLHPTLRRSAKDGAPGVLWLAESGKGVDLVGLAVYIPPFAKARRMGHPGFWGGLSGEKAWTWWCWRFTSHPSQRREGWGTRDFVELLRLVEMLLLRY